MTEPAQKCENDNLYKRNFTPKLFIAFEMAYCCCFCLGGNLDFLQKKFYNIVYSSKTFCFVSLTTKEGNL